VPGGDLAMSHLIEAAHQRVAYVGGPFSIRQVADCRDGAVQALQRVGRDPDDLPMIETAALNIPAGQRDAAGSIELSARSRPAVVCASDPPALGLLQKMTGEFPGDDTHQHHQVIFEPELAVRQSTRDEPRLMRRLPRPPSAAEAAG
jgi:DNA-binding LacI/PurR family transcriptional regulator